jgi:hypothetical protein
MFFPVSVLFLSACSEYSTTKAMDSGFASADTVQEGPADSGANEDTVVPSWFALSGVVTLQGGLFGEGTLLSLTIVGEDGQTELCTSSLDPSSLIAGEPPESSVSFWWEGTLVVAESTCEDSLALPATLGLGIGEILPDIQARLGAEGLSDLGEQYLYGAFLRTGLEVDAFGYMGSSENLSGDTLAVFPPPDGSYQLVPLYLASLPDDL